MGKIKNSIAIISMVLTIILLVSGDGWAVASFAKKYGMGCKSCHSFGSELNSLGQTFKKNGHTFGEKSAEPKAKSKQGEPRDDKTAGSGARGDTDDSSAVSDTGDAEQPVPETKVYSWKSSDGTPHFSDTPYVDSPSETKKVSKKVTKKSSRTGFSPLSAVIPKKSRRTIIKTAAPEEDKTITSSHELSEPLESQNIEAMPVAQPRSYKECMEKVFITYPSPKTPDDAMQQFREAESSCAAFDKNPRR